MMIFNVVRQEQKACLNHPENYKLTNPEIIENFLLLSELDKVNLPQYVAVLTSLEPSLLVHALDQLIELWKDLNWPGSWDAFEFLVQLDSDIYLEKLEEKIQEAIEQRDAEWLLNIQFFLEKASVEVSKELAEVLLVNKRNLLD